MAFNYKFHDLATFVEDIKFLLTHGGGLGSQEGHKSITEIVVLWIWTAMVWLAIALVVYIIYKLIYTGYSRFLVDVTKLKFFHKVDVKKEVGGTQGFLFKNFYSLQNDSDIKQAMSIMKMPNVGRKALETIAEYYSHQNDGDQFENALSDYFSYYNAVTDGLNMRHMLPKDKSTKVRALFKTVFQEYGMFYSKLVAMIKSWSCMFNEGKDDSSRKRLNMEKEKLAQQIRDLYEKWNIRPVETNKMFAASFPEPSFVGKCGTSSETIVAHELKSSGFEDNQRTISNKEHELSKLLKRPSKNKDAIQALENEINTLKVEMAKTRAEAENRAYQSLAQGVNAEEIKLSPTSSKGPNSKEAKPIVTFSDNSNVHPNFKKAQNNKLFTVFVPCYDLYKQYFLYNKEARFAKYLSQPYDMTEDEVVAYIFLVDLNEFLQEQNQRRNVISLRIIETYFAIDALSHTAKTTVTKEDTPVAYSQYVIVPDDNSVETATRVLVANKSKVADLNDFVNHIRKASLVNSQTEHYIFYLAEIFAYMIKQGNIEKSMSLFGDQNKNKLIAYLNLPYSIQRENEVLQKFDINAELATFLHSRPILVMIMLNRSSSSNVNESYDEVMKFILKTMGNPQDVKDVSQLNESFVGKCIRNMKQRAYGLKKLVLTMHIINLYLNDYRDSVVTKDKKNKIQVTKEGLIDIIADHYIPYGIPDFFNRLFRPFKVEFIDGRLKSSWTQTFYRPRFKFIKPGKKDKEAVMGTSGTNSISYWREFNAFWIDYVGKMMKKMMKDWKKSFENIGKKET